MVRMTHPTLPDQPIDVREKAVAHWERCGWHRADDEQPAEPESGFVLQRTVQPEDDESTPDPQD